MPITGGTVTLPGSRTIIPSPNNLGIAMADTRILKSKIEDYVRDWLKVKFGQPFHSSFLLCVALRASPELTNSTPSPKTARLSAASKPHHGKLAARSEALERCMELTWSYISWTMYARAKDTWSSPIQNLSSASSAKQQAGLEQPYQNTREIWCRRRESNPRPRDYETLALPLSYAGTRQFSIVRSIRGECQADERAFKHRHGDDSAPHKAVPEGANGH